MNLHCHSHVINVINRIKRFCKCNWLSVYYWKVMNINLSGIYFCPLTIIYQAEKGVMTFALSYMTHRCPCSASHPALIRFYKWVTRFKNKIEIIYKFSLETIPTQFMSKIKTWKLLAAFFFPFFFFLLQNKVFSWIKMNMSWAWSQICSYV